MNLGAWTNDLRVAFRRLRRSPVYTGIALLTLGLGFGANTAMFSIVDSLLLRPLPYQDPGRLAVVFGAAEMGSQQQPMSPANYLDLKARAESFEDIAAAEAWGPTLGGEEQPEKLSGLRVTPNLFAVLGVQPAAGRPFQQEDGEDGAPPVVILSSGMASRLGGTQAVLGKQFQLDGIRRTVVGVMPERFVFPTFWAPNAQLWTPLQWDSATLANRRMSTLRLFGRLRDGRSFEVAQQEVQRIAAGLAAEHPSANAGLSARAVPLEIVSGGNVRPTVLTLFLAVAALLLVACANLAGLLVARATERKQELAVRLALGASGTRMRTAVAAESVVLIGAGCLAALGFAAWGMQTASSLIPPSALETIYGAGMVQLNGSAFAFTLSLGVLAMFLFGWIPAMLATSHSPANALRERGGTENRRMGWLRSGLVVGQCAMALALVVTSMLLARSFRNLARADAGFDADRVISFVAPVTGTAESQPGRKAVFYRALVERLEALPGVTNASAVNHVPLLGDEWGTLFVVEGKPMPEPGTVPRAVYRVMMPGYLETVGAKLLAGRDFTNADSSESTPVVIVNETLARRQWPDESAIGKRLRVGSPDSNGPWHEVVGVVADMQQGDWSTSIQEEVMLAFAQDATFRDSPRAPFAMTLAARTNGDPEVLAPQIREAVWGLAPDIPVAQLRPLSDGVEEEFWRPRLAASIGIALAVLAALLSALGIYGVLTQWVNRQRRSIGIRMALGQSPGAVLRGFLMRGIAVAACGALLGLPLAVASGQLAQSVLVGVTAMDAASLSVGVLLLIAVGAGATWLPARKAAGIDPANSLRAE